MFLAYMNLDFGPFQADLARRVSSSIKDRFGAGVESRTKYASRKHLSVEEIEEIVDPNSQIITFSSASRMIENAKTWLAPKFSAAFIGMRIADQMLVDAARSIRHFIAHDSDRALREMNEQLARIEMQPENKGLAGC